MNISVKFWSYFADLTDCKQAQFEIENGATLTKLHEAVCEQFPKLSDSKNSTLKAVGLEYENDEFILSDGDEVSFFPPVQGG